MKQTFFSISSFLVNHENSHSRKMAILYTFFSQIFFTIMFYFIGTMRKSYSAYQIVTGRMAMGLIFNVIYCKLQNIPIYPANSYQFKMMSARGILTSGGMILFFLSMKYLNLSDAVVISNTNPIGASFLATIYLHEKQTKQQLISIFTWFLGIIFIVRPAIIFGEKELTQNHLDEGRNQLIGCILGLGSSICTSVAVVIISQLQLKEKINSAQLLLYAHFVTVLASGMCETIFPNDSFFVNKQLVISMLIIGVCGFLGQFLFSRTFTLDKASIIAPMQYTEVLFSFFVDIFFFGEEIYLSSVLGAIIIVISCLVIVAM